MVNMAPTADPEPGPWRGYETIPVIISLTNNNRFDIPAGTPFRMVHGVGSTNGSNPNPDDPDEPNGPGTPYINVYREILVSSSLPAVQSGQTIYFRAKIHVPTGLGYSNQLMLKVQ